jgi:two-component system cell cycle response regulator DivK
MAQILVVEDEQSNQEVITRMLEFRGHSVMLACNGEEALRLAEAHRPDLILMDLAMPVMDGWTTTSILKAHPHLAEIPVIAVSSYDGDAEAGQAMAVGCEGILPKPIDYFDLMKLVDARVAC